jgi:hypothetical protein
MPVKPSAPATSAKIKKISVQPNIRFLSSWCCVAQISSCKSHAGWNPPRMSLFDDIQTISQEKFMQNAKPAFHLFANRNCDNVGDEVTRLISVPRV